MPFFPDPEKISPAVLAVDPHPGNLLRADLKGKGREAENGQDPGPGNRIKIVWFWAGLCF